MKFIYIYLLLGFVLFGCENQSENSTIYIGGEIINPQSDFVLVMQNDKVIDSIHLNTDNTFGKWMQGLASGLYYFKHGYEFQYLFLEPNDSIKLRLNTWDFDETIVFEGKGAAKNELLINLFLENEKESKMFYSYFSLPENEFQEKINDAKKRHTEQLNTLIVSEPNLSDKYLHLANAAINYPLYSLKELYSYYHKKMMPSDSSFTVSDSFYAYRENINLNDTNLSDYHSYESFVTTHLYNIAYHTNNEEINNSSFYPILLNLISKNIKEETIKNKLLQREIDHVFINRPELIDTNILSVFYSNCTDSIAVANFKQAIVAKKSLKINSQFPDFKVYAADGTNEKIQSITKNKDVVLYFWSSNTVSDEYLSKRVSFLINKHPEVSFIGINTDKSNTYKSSCLSKLKNQYYINAASEGNNLISNKFPRAILINSKGNVTNSFTVLTSNCINDQITDLLSK